MMKKLSFFGLACACLMSWGQQYSQKWSNVNYVGDGQTYHNLDIYLPKTTKPKYPVVIHIYGSAFLSNNGKGSADLTTVVASLLDAGFAVVTPNHRSSNDAIYPAQIHDIKAVIRFLRGNSATYKLDTSFVGTSGFSSGGQLASLAGTTRNVKSFTRGSITMNLEGTLGNYTSQSSYVNAVCEWSGPTDFLKMDSCGSSLNNNAADSPASKLIGGAIQQNKDKSQMTNPITFVDPTDPPFLVIHGTSDNIVPYCQGQLLDKALKSKGVSSRLITVQNGGHSVASAHLNDMVQFFLGQLSLVTSVQESSLEGGLSVYVSPTGEQVYVHGNSDLRNANYEIVDISGKRMKTGSLDNPEIEASSLQNGLYVLRIFMNNGKGHTLKFVK